MSSDVLSGLIFILLLFSFMFYSIVVGREVGDCRKELVALNDNIVTLIDLIQKSINDRRDGEPLEIRAAALAHTRIDELRRARRNDSEVYRLVDNGELAVDYD